MDARAPGGTTLAVVAEALYLANLTLAPGFAFAALAVLWVRHHRSAPPLARDHLQQTFWVSLWGGLLILLVTGSIVVASGGWRLAASGRVWVVAILYFTCIHSTLVLLGAIGLARALSGRTFRFPLIGPALVS